MAEANHGGERNLASDETRIARFVGGEVELQARPADTMVQVLRRAPRTATGGPARSKIWTDDDWEDINGEPVDLDGGWCDVTGNPTLDVDGYSSPRRTGNLTGFKSSQIDWLAQEKADRAKRALSVPVRTSRPGQ